MVANHISEIAGLSSIVNAICNRVIFDPFEIHISFEGDMWLLLGCSMELETAQGKWAYSPDSINYLNCNFPVYKCIDQAASEIISSKDCLALIFPHTKLSLNLKNKGMEAFSFNSLVHGNTIFIPE